MSREPCEACHDYPCQGSHMMCTLELFAAHRGLTVAQARQVRRFEERSDRAWLERQAAALRDHHRCVVIKNLGDDSITIEHGRPRVRWT